MCKNWVETNYRFNTNSDNKSRGHANCLLSVLASSRHKSYQTSSAPPTLQLPVTSYRTSVITLCVFTMKHESPRTQHSRSTAIENNVDGGENCGNDDHCKARPRPCKTQDGGGDDAKLHNDNQSDNENGERRTANGERRTANGERRTANGDRRTMLVRR